MDIEAQVSIHFLTAPMKNETLGTLATTKMHPVPEHHCNPTYGSSALLFRRNLRAKSFANSTKLPWDVRTPTVAARGLAAYAVDHCRLGGKCDNSVVVSTETSMTIPLLMEAKSSCDCARVKRRGSSAPTVLGRV